MKASLGVVLSVSLSLASCAKKPTTQIKVKVTDNYSGFIHLVPCVPGAPEPVELNEAGRGTTTACPAGDVQIVVVKPTKTFNIESKDVQVRRQSDGTAIAILAQIPKA
jgi:hypothetical protein